MNLVFSSFLIQFTKENNFLTPLQLQTSPKLEYFVYKDFQIGGKMNTALRNSYKFSTNSKKLIGLI